MRPEPRFAPKEHVFQVSNDKQNKFACNRSILCLRKKTDCSGCHLVADSSRLFWQKLFPESSARETEKESETAWSQSQAEKNNNGRIHNQRQSCFVSGARKLIANQCCSPLLYCSSSMLVVQTSSEKSSVQGVLLMDYPRIMLLLLSSLIQMNLNPDFYRLCRSDSDTAALDWWNKQIAVSVRLQGEKARETKPEILQKVFLWRWHQTVFFSRHSDGCPYLRSCPCKKLLMSPAKWALAHKHKHTHFVTFDNLGWRITSYNFMLCLEGGGGLQNKIAVAFHLLMCDKDWRAFPAQTWSATADFLVSRKHCIVPDSIHGNIPVVIDNAAVIGRSLPPGKGQTWSALFFHLVFLILTVTEVFFLVRQTFHRSCH